MKKYKYNVKRIIIALGLLIAIFLMPFMAWFYYQGTFGPHARYVKTTFDRVPKWKDDSQEQALQAFKQSCEAILKLHPESSMHQKEEYGKAKDWQIICLAAHQIKKVDKQNAQQFFETWFEPYRIENNFNPKGLFTGYYLPAVQGNLKRTKQYSIPIYGLPEDLVKINLNSFNKELGNQILVGQVKENTVTPYPDRESILNNGLSKKTPILAWGNNTIDIFFAQIQGSAIVNLPHHKQLLLGYASSNGRPYTAIGKVLIQNKALAKDKVSMQSIRTWLVDHPTKMNDVLNQNANYVFFRILKNKDPLGTEQVPVTPERTLAVDTQYIALGTPVWLSTTVPKESSQDVPFQHLLIAQDTGGAIRGVVRGDIYWGPGEKAAYIAGHLKNPGEYWVLLPKSVSR